MHSYSPRKEALRRWVPEPLLRLRRTWLGWRRDHLTKRLANSFARKVLFGPFAGMLYPGEAVGSAAGPKLLGTYESELHQVVEQLVIGGFDTIINVGAGEGYYAVGLLTRLPDAFCVAFELEEHGHPLIRRAAELNGSSERLEIRGRCSPQALANALAGAERPLVVMDVEGAEDVLLDPEVCPDLRQSAILVEVHEHLKPGITGLLLERFTRTHTLNRILTVGVDGYTIPTVDGFTQRQLRLLSDEMRSFPMEWFWMTPTLGFQLR